MTSQSTRAGGARRIASSAAAPLLKTSTSQRSRSRRSRSRACPRCRRQHERRGRPARPGRARGVDSARSFGRAPQPKLPRRRRGRVRSAVELHGARRTNAFVGGRCAGRAGCARERSPGTRARSSRRSHRRACSRARGRARGQCPSPRGFASSRPRSGGSARRAAGARRRNARSRVLDLQVGAVVARPGADRDLTIERELERVREQVQDDLFPHVAVDEDALAERRAVDVEGQAGRSIADRKLLARSVVRAERAVSS